MNILVANISKFSFKKTEYEYEIKFPNSSLKTVKAYQTNESILKAFSSIKSIQENGGINKIIMLVSNEVIKTRNTDYENQTSCEYYLRFAKEYFPDVETIQIKIENDDKTPRENASILSEICSEIKSSDVVYIDSAGGQRNIGNLIQLFTKILNYKGIHNPYILYADIQNSPAFIGDTKDFQNMMKLADALNEFMTTGKTRQLSSYYSQNMTFVEFKNLLDAMTEFSDKIQLGDIDNLEESIKKLDLCIKECEKITASFDIGTVILKQFLPVVRNKLIGNLDGKVDYLKIIEWCVENNLIQQALTLFVEKIPMYLFETRVITYSGNILEARKNFDLQKNPLASNWDSYAFYSEILEQKENLAIELERYIEFGRNPDSENGKNAVKILNRMKNEWNNLSKFELDYKYLVDKKNQTKITDFAKFKTIIRNDRKIMYKLLGFEDESEIDTYEKKFKAIEKIKKSDFYFGSFKFNTSPKKVAEIYYAYIFVKMLRNRINHALSDDRFTSDQKETLKEYGFAFERFSVAIVRKNLKNAIKIIRESSYKNSNKTETLEEDAIEPENYSTDLKVGDRVEAFCTDQKIVRIESYNYNIQLVIPPAHNAFEYVDNKLLVEIKQISKKGKIVQVGVVKIL